MTEKHVILDSAAFMDSPQALALTNCSTQEIRTIAQRFLSACYRDLGQEPRHMDGEGVKILLCDLLPRHFGVRDPLAAKTPEVLHAFRSYLKEAVMVSHSFEMDLAFDTYEDAFLEAVQSGAAHREGLAVTSGPSQPVTRGDKVGRNDPCPCGSGKKFKKCCQQLGGS